MSESTEEQTQRLQNKVDTVKTLSFLANAHNITPPIKKEDDTSKDIAIIKALESTPRILEIFLEARGMMIDQKTRKVIQMAKPYMNVDGAWRLAQICKKIAQEAEWSNFEEERIPDYVDHFYRENIPYFTFWHEDLGLDPSDFNYVMTTLKMFILSSFYKAKNGKYINLVGRTYSEDFLGKALKGEEQNKKSRGLADLNPFRRLD